MPVVDVTEIIAAPLHRVWELVNDVEAFPRLMEHVQSLTLVERGPGYRLTDWHCDLKGCVMQWREREDIDEARHRIDYRQVDGDLAAFEGYWQLEPLSDNTTRVTLSVHVDIGIPMLSEMLNPVVERAIRDNSHIMLTSIASEAVQAPAERQKLAETP